MTNGEKYKNEILEIIIEALEKRIPQKLILDGYGYGACPSCNTSYYIGDEPPNYGCCPMCGQEIDWSEVNEDLKLI